MALPQTITKPPIYCGCLAGLVIVRNYFKYLEIHSIDRLVDYWNDLWKFDGSEWTWMSGSNQGNQKGTYGIKGVSSQSNIPGGRYNSLGWVDNEGSFWVFGGYGYDNNGIINKVRSNSINTAVLRELNDLWRYNGNWTWISGNSIGNQKGNYGNQGVKSSSNIPGGRRSMVGDIDFEGNIWIFGGYGYPDSTIIGNSKYS
jgi:hypothetical protein